jgi:Flp pilus assembly protein TadD
VKTWRAESAPPLAATDSLQRSVLLGEDHSESHFNLALAYERRGLERETLAALRQNPGQPDAWNSLGVIYAEEGKTVRASLVWRKLVREEPDYKPARRNLALLGSQVEVARSKTPLSRISFLELSGLPARVSG